VVFDPDALKLRAATPSRWADVERLFGPRGACAGCWCMVWRLSRKDWVAGKGAKNRRALRKIVTSGSKPGVLAYHGKEPIARVLAPVDDRPVWSISCLFVSRPYRRRGVSVRLLRAAVELAAKQGARIVEGYPTLPFATESPDAFLWTGTASAFLEAGFEEVARRSVTRPIMRCACASR
jgi:GNAT superfamily N-acetyltransferase